MTKNKLVKKVLSGAKNFALGAGIFGASLIYSNNVNAQVSTLNEKGSATGTKVLQKDMLNAYDIPGYVIIERTAEEDKKKNVVKKSGIESLRVYPTFSTMRGNNQLVPRLVYSPVKAQVEGQDVDVIKYRSDEKDRKSIEDLFAKKGEGGGVIILSATEAQAAGFHTIMTDDGTTFVYFPIDEKENTLDNEGKQKVEKGKRIGVVFPADNMVIFEDINTSDRSVEYLVGKPNQVYHLDLNENEIVDQKLHEEGTKTLDSLGRKYLSSKKAEDIYLSGNLIDGKAYDFKNFAFLNDTKEEEKEPSKINGRIKLGAGVTAPLGYLVELNPQIKIGEKTFLGPYFSYTNTSRSLEKITQEEPQRVLISLPANMYWVSTGTKLTETNKVTNNLGLGLSFTYVQPDWEASIKAGLLGQKTKQILKSEGTQYMEINGAQDPASVYNYNESNETETKKSLFNGSPVYTGASAEYFPLHKKGNALSNISVAGEAGYVFGNTAKESGFLGSLGIKYTLGKTKKQNKTEQK